ncbi:sugar kinase [Frigoribacterium sp. 2-23]|uniref:sugar kinase n=1 Tax=Frigoribacterium sp. 2-23 TaxID=3415006 RepID=UPI003C6EB433
MTGTPYVVTIGETMGLLSTVTPGPLSHAATMTLGIGGSESNVAIGVSRLGVGSVWMGRVGDDAVGRLVEREIRAEGVEARVIVDPEAPTGLMLKERRTATSQSVNYYRAGSAGSRLSPDDLDEELLAGAAVVHVTGITAALSASADQAIRRAVQIARQNGALVSYDVNYRSKLWSTDRAAEFARSLLPSCDVVFAGEDEAAMVLGGEPGATSPTPPEFATDKAAKADKAAEAAAPTTAPALSLLAGRRLELACGLARLGPAQAVVKCGADGAVALIDGHEHVRPGVPIVPHDTVGAGDAFVAGYLAELALTRPAEARLLTAVTTAAFVCLSPGDWEGLPRRAELDLLSATEPVQR